MSTLAQGNANQSYTIEATCEIKTGQVLTPYNIKISSQVLLSNDEVEFIRGKKNEVFRGLSNRMKFKSNNIYSHFNSVATTFT